MNTPAGLNVQEAARYVGVRVELLRADEPMDFDGWARDYLRALVALDRAAALRKAA